MKKGISNAVCGTTTKFRMGCRCDECGKVNKEYWSTFRLKNKEKLLIAWKEQHYKNKEKRNAQSKDYGVLHKEQTKQKQKEKRLVCLNHYSNGTLSCKCCQEGIYEFLCLDHINGGGTQHRKKLRGRLENFLIRENFPEGYQVLCHNCNMAKGFYGKCPHKV